MGVLSFPPLRGGLNYFARYAGWRMDDGSLNTGALPGHGHHLHCGGRCAG
jgi:hypothetical protein